MKFEVILIFIYFFALCQADISLTQISENRFEGYDYPKPKIEFPLPSKTSTLPPTPKIAVKSIETIPSTYLPPIIPSTYLPPDTTTTKKLTTTRTTTTSKPTVKTIIKEEAKIGYDYPKPEIEFPLPSKATTLPPTPKIAVKSIETIPPTYLPPIIPSTYLPPDTTTTKKLTTTRTTTTSKPTVRTIIKEEAKIGYDYPKPEIEFPLPSKATTLPPTPKIAVKSIETIPPTYLPPIIPSTYLPPDTTTTTKLTTTRTTTTSKPTVRKIIKEEAKIGYDYPKPKIEFPLPSKATTLPPTPKIEVKSIETIPSTYLPPIIPSTYLPPDTTTTKKLTTTRTTTTSKPTVKTIIKEEAKIGYDYPKPEIEFPLPSKVTTLPPTPKIAVKSIETIPPTYLQPIIPSTYLPPDTTTTTKLTTTRTTTKKLTTTRTTTTSKPTVRTIIKEEAKIGYDYPKPKIEFPLPSKTSTLPPTPKIAVKAIETIPSTYLPPIIPSTYLPPDTTTTKKLTTTRTTTTSKPTVKTIIKEEAKIGYDYPKPEIEFPLPSKATTLPPTPKIAVKSIETIPPTYLQPIIPSTYLPPDTTTTTKLTTTRTTTKKLTTTRTTTTSKPTVKTIIKEEAKIGYDYPKPKIEFPLPSKTSTLPPTPKIAVKSIETIPSTYLPPIIPSTYLPPDTTTTKKLTTTRTTTTSKPTVKTIIKEEAKIGYDYPKPKIEFPLPSKTSTLPPTPKIAVKSIETIPSTYLPPIIPSTYLPPDTTTTKKLTTTRTTTTSKPTVRTIIKEEAKIGYDYPKPEIAFLLPS